jgi:hypothetical protein
VPAQGFEPWTIGLKDRCSAKLSYAGVAVDYFGENLGVGPMVAKYKIALELQEEDRSRRCQSGRALQCQDQERLSRSSP